MDIKEIKDITIKCHKCRNVLLKEVKVVQNSGHCDSKSCSSYDLKTFIYMFEDKVPPWVKLKIEGEQWTKGKLHCENCGCKIGSFDFISGRKCDCGNSVLPPIHFITSQVDIPMMVT